jgi:hypothetical protein
MSFPDTGKLDEFFDYTGMIRRLDDCFDHTGQKFSSIQNRMNE